MNISTKRPLKIAMVTDVYGNHNNGGAISLERFVKSLRKNHQVTVLATGENEEDKIVIPSFYFPFVKNIMVKMKFVFAWPNRKVLQDAFKNVDLVHIQFPFYLGMKSVKIAKEMNIPIVSAFHVQPENIIFNIGIRSPWMIKVLYKLFINKVFNKTDAVICPSPFAEEELKRYGLKVPTIVISNGVPQKFKPLKVKRPEELNDKFIILSVGRLAKDKRHDILIQAINRSKYRDSIQLIITGQGPVEEKLQKLGKILPHPPMFKYVPIEELIDLFNIADLYVHPSEVELESMSVLEATACGLPTLISDSEYSAAKQFAINENFLFKSNDINNLTEKLEYWIDHQSELKKYRTQYHTQSKKFAIDDSISKVENLYHEYVKVSSNTCES